MKALGPAVCAAVVVLFSSWYAVEAGAGDFSAEYVSVIAGQSTPGRLFVSDRKARLETGGAVVISRADKGVVWILLPDTLVYMELPLAAQYLVFGKDEVPGEKSRELVETEFAGSVTAEKYRVVFDLGTREDAVFTWIPPGETLPVKTAAADGSWETVYSGMTPASHPEALFELPPGFTNVAADALALPETGPGISGEEEGPADSE